MFGLTRFTDYAHAEYTQVPSAYTRERGEKERGREGGREGFSKF